MGVSIEELTMNEWLDQKWIELWNKVEAQGYSRLTLTEQVWTDVRVLIDSTANGGVISYFINSGADRLRQCLFALRVLGADTARAQLERVMALFPDGVPETMEERNRVISSCDYDEKRERLFEDVDDNMFREFDRLEQKLASFLAHNGLSPPALVPYKTDAGSSGEATAAKEVEGGLER